MQTLESCRKDYVSLHDRIRNTHGPPRSVWSIMGCRKHTKKPNLSLCLELRDNFVSCQPIKEIYMEYTMSNQGDGGRINLLKKRYLGTHESYLWNAKLSLSGGKVTVICRVHTSQASDPRDETTGNHNICRETGAKQAAETVDEI